MQKQKICFMLAVWGASYVDQFFKRSLRTLLAEGNVPALAEECDCTFLFLTKPEDVAIFRRQPLFAALEKLCTVRFEYIADIIFPFSHSATLTVSFERGMRSLGAAMTDTYFIYLMSDYIFAERALSALLPHIRRGVSAITAGNFQIIEEEVVIELENKIDPDGILRLDARELVQWSLDHLHPVTVANIVNEESTYTIESNRLFWRVDAHTMIGCFYLRHTLCLKPETSHFTIGASWDYSYLSAMCPSGNVAHLQDSDEYFVIELQPIHYETKYIRGGKPTAARLAPYYAQWTTAEQRANATIPVIYHAKEIPALCAPMVEESQVFMRQVEAAMALPPAPLTLHPYWASCIQSIAGDTADAPQPGLHFNGLRDAIYSSPTFGPILLARGINIDSLPPFSDMLHARRQRWMRYVISRFVRLSGFPRATTFLHPLYLDYRHLNRIFAKLSADQSLLVVIACRVRAWIKWSDCAAALLRSELIRFRPAASLRQELAHTPGAWLTVTMENISTIGALLNALGNTLPNGAELWLYVPYNTIFHSSFITRKMVKQKFSYLFHRPNLQLEATILNGGLLRGALDFLCQRPIRVFANATRISESFIKSILVGPLVILLYAMYHLLYFIMPPLGGVGSSALLKFRVERP